MSPILLLTWGLLGCAPAEPEPEEPIVDPVTDLQWADVLPAVELTVVTLPAVLTPASGGSTVLAPPVAARIESWHVRPGDEVAVGTLLATLSSPAWAARSDALAGQQAVVDAVTAQVQLGVASGRELATAQVERAEAAASLRTVGSELRPSGRDFTWHAVRAGTVQAITCAPGEAADTDHPCLVLVDAGVAWARVQLPDRYHGLVTDPFLDFHPATGGPAVRMAAAASAAVYDPTTHTRDLWFAAPDAAWPVGLSGRGDVGIPAPPGTLVVPSAALTRVDGHDVVFVQRDPAHPIGVEHLGRSGAAAVVRAADLLPTDRVAISGLLRLKARLLDEEAP